MSCEHYAGIRYNKNVIKPLFTVRCGLTAISSDYVIRQFTTEKGAQEYACKVCQTENIRCVQYNAKLREPRP